MSKKIETPEVTSTKLTVALPPLVEPEAPVDPDNDMAAALAPPKPVNKPDVSRLPDATLDGKPIFAAGDRIVIERYNGILAGNPYLDTKTFLVNSVDMETGKVRLFDESLIQHATDNWKGGLARGQVYKFAHGFNVSTKRKRGRPRKAPVAPPTEAPVSTEPKKRGRPKGSKNRDKAVIVAEKAAKRAAKSATPKKKGKK
jgi:hypothetical protein